MRKIGDVGDPLNPLLDVERHGFRTDADLEIVRYGSGLK